MAAKSEKCLIDFPLSTQPLQQLLQALRSRMQHNFYPCVLTMAGTVVALHFQSFIAKLKSCPITLAYGPGESGSGKTTALHCLLSLIGADELRFFRELTLAKVLQLCSTTNILLALDDPDTKGTFSKFIICTMELNGGPFPGVRSSPNQPLLSVTLTSYWKPHIGY